MDRSRDRRDDRHLRRSPGRSSPPRRRFDSERRVDNYRPEPSVRERNERDRDPREMRRPDGAHHDERRDPFEKDRRARPVDLRGPSFVNREPRGGGFAGGLRRDLSDRDPRREESRRDSSGRGGLERRGGGDWRGGYNGPSRRGPPPPDPDRDTSLDYIIPRSNRYFEHDSRAMAYDDQANKGKAHDGREEMERRWTNQEEEGRSRTVAPRSPGRWHHDKFADATKPVIAEDTKSTDGTPSAPPAVAPPSSTAEEAVPQSEPAAVPMEYAIPERVEHDADSDDEGKRR